MRETVIALTKQTLDAITFDPFSINWQTLDTAQTTIFNGRSIPDTGMCQYTPEELDQMGLKELHQQYIALMNFISAERQYKHAAEAYHEDLLPEQLHPPTADSLPVSYEAEQWQQILDSHQQLLQTLRQYQTLAEETEQRRFELQQAYQQLSTTVTQLPTGEHAAAEKIALDFLQIAKQPKAKEKDYGTKHAALNLCIAQLQEQQNVAALKRLFELLAAEIIHQQGEHIYTSALTHIPTNAITAYYDISSFAINIAGLLLRNSQLNSQEKYKAAKLLQTTAERKQQDPVYEKDHDLIAEVISLLFVASQEYLANIQQEEFVVLSVELLAECAEANFHLYQLFHAPDNQANALKDVELANQALETFRTHCPDQQLPERLEKLKHDRVEGVRKLVEGEISTSPPKARKHSAQTFDFTAVLRGGSSAAATQEEEQPHAPPPLPKAKKDARRTGKASQQQPSLPVAIAAHANELVALVEGGKQPTLEQIQQYYHLWHQYHTQQPDGIIQETNFSQACAYAIYLLVTYHHPFTEESVKFYKEAWETYNHTTPQTPIDDTPYAFALKLIGDWHYGQRQYETAEGYYTRAHTEVTQMHDAQIEVTCLTTIPLTEGLEKEQGISNKDWILRQLANEIKITQEAKAEAATTEPELTTMEADVATLLAERRRESTERQQKKAKRSAAQVEDDEDEHQVEAHEQRRDKRRARPKTAEEIVKEAATQAAVEASGWNRRLTPGGDFQPDTQAIQQHELHAAQQRVAQQYAAQQAFLAQQRQLLLLQQQQYAAQQLAAQQGRQHSSSVMHTSASGWQGFPPHSNQHQPGGQGGQYFG